MSPHESSTAGGQLAEGRPELLRREGSRQLPREAGREREPFEGDERGFRQAALRRDAGQHDDVHARGRGRPRVLVEEATEGGGGQRDGDLSHAGDVLRRRTREADEDSMCVAAGRCVVVR